MNNQSVLCQVSLEEASLIISKALIEQKLYLMEMNRTLQARKAQYDLDYIEANDGDSSENVPLQEARNNLRMVSGEIANNLRMLQALNELEDVYYLRQTYDFRDIEDTVNMLEEENKTVLFEIFKVSDISSLINTIKNISIDELENGIVLFIQRCMKDRNAVNPVNTCLEELASYYAVASSPEYNYCGIIVPYSTVKLERDGQIMVYKIYPDNVSFVDAGVMASNSRLSQALLGKKKGDTVMIQDKSNSNALYYKILDLY